MNFLRTSVIFTVAAFFPATAAADAGVLIPFNDEQPDPRKLSLEEMDLDILIDDGTARVAIRQIFRNRTSSRLEGQWVFALPAQAVVSDFAVWDDMTRIPGVILERRRAAEIYESLKAQSIDPGLLQQGEYGDEEARRSAVFSAKVTPIPVHGFKRVEVEYHEKLAVENLRSFFAVPLRPEAYQVQTARKLTVRLELRSSHPVSGFRSISDAFPLRIIEQSDNHVVAAFEGAAVNFSEDLAVDFFLAPPGDDPLRILTFRDPRPDTPHPSAFFEPAAESPPGYFLARMLLAPTAVELRPPVGGEGPPQPIRSGPPRALIALLDTSLSMQWGKLDRAYRALERLLLALRPQDRFNIVTFDSSVRSFEPAPTAADRATLNRALEWVRNGRIRGGSDLDAALAAGLSQLGASAGRPYLVLISDGGATRGSVSNARIAANYARARSALPEDRRPRTYVFGVGDDANLPLLRLLTREQGLYEHVRSSEPIDFKLSAFVEKIGKLPLAGLSLETTPQDAVDMVYPLEPTRFPGSVASWAGRYVTPAVEAVFHVVGLGPDPAAELSKTVLLPESDLDHPHVARTWARARVDALLEQIERDGEDAASIDEIIHWAKKFKFVTPYTSFLAAPRSLLRPRVIRPGDPILRVRTDESIVSVTALFPFGLTKQLVKLDDEDIWQTRFLAPKDTPDGEHEVRLLLRDSQGRVYREKKSFLIVSKPPTVRVRLAKKAYRRGERVDLKVAATRTTRTLTARMYGVPAVSLRWNPAEGYNTGSLVIPPDLPPGDYSLRLTAEDFAHNIGVEEAPIAVLP